MIVYTGVFQAFIENLKEAKFAYKHISVKSQLSGKVN